VYSLAPLDDQQSNFFEAAAAATTTTIKKKEKMEFVDGNVCPPPQNSPKTLPTPMILLY